MDQFNALANDLLKKGWPRHQIAGLDFETEYKYTYKRKSPKDPIVQTTKKIAFVHSNNDIVEIFINNEKIDKTILYLSGMLSLTLTKPTGESVILDGVEDSNDNAHLRRYIGQFQTGYVLDSFGDYVFYYNQEDTFRKIFYYLFDK